MQKNQFLKVKNSLSELEKKIIELKERYKNYFLNRLFLL